MQTRSRFLMILGTLVLVVISSLPALAQTDTATINGRVVDPQGAVVPGVKVHAVNINTNISYPTETNDVGLYSIRSLPPGTYRVIVEKQGFAQIVKPDVQLHIQDIAELNFSLQIGSVTQSVTVEGGAPLINESPAVGTVIDRQFVQNLPLNGRSFNTLLQLTPGVVIVPSNGLNGQFSIAGQRADANNFLIDGVSANFGAGNTGLMGSTATGGTQAFSAMGGTSGLVSVEALQEFRIQTSSYAPEFGRSPGGQVIISTRSGTNAFHGGGYDYFRNDKLDANDWFANAARKPRAAERHNDFGGFLGGPIWKNQTFFFFSYEGARLRVPATASANVPSVASRTSAPAALAPFLNAYPVPNGPVAPNGTTALFTGKFSNPATLNATSIRIDHTLSSRFSIFGRYNIAPSQFANRVNSLSMQRFTTANTQTLTIGSDMLLSNQISNSLRGNYSTQSSSQINALDSFGGAVPLDPQLLIKPLLGAETAVTFTLSNASALLFGLGAENRTRQFNIVDDVSITHGAHQLKFGVDYRAIAFDKNTVLHFVTFSRNTVQAFVTGGTANLNAQTRHPGGLLSQSLSLYGQDTWKMTRRLTLTYGLRWELSPAPSARGTTTLASWTNVDNPAAIALAPAGTPLWSTRHANFAPRVGVAYNLTQKEDFVLRAGWGLFYDLGAGSSADLSGTFPNSINRSTVNVSLPVTDVTPFLPVISLTPPFNGVIEGFSPSLKLPRSYQWNVALEKSFAGKQVISATYLGQAGRQLLRREDQNAPNANFGNIFMLTENGARSGYHAMQLQYRRPLAERIQALFSYTWSHSIDNASDDTVDFVSGVVFSGQNDRGQSGFDVRHSFSGALVYELPSISKSKPFDLLTKGWSLETVIVARSGFPFNGLTFVGTSPVPSRPDVVSGTPYWIQDSAAPGGRSLNPAAFLTPSTTRQGSEGRNDIPGFGLTQVDFSLGRKIPITERINLQFRADVFNVFNHPNFANPTALVPVNLFGTSFLASQSMLNGGLGVGGLNPLFQEGGPRSLQLSLKWNF